MCHAHINGDLITDFGYGNPFFMGTDKPINHPAQTTYGPFASKHLTSGGWTWANSSVMGDIYVPDQTISDPTIINAYKNPLAGNALLSGALRILDFANGRFVNPTISTSSAVTLIPRSTSPDINSPGLRGKFFSRKKIWIDSPTEDEIRTLEQRTGAELVYSQLGIVVYKASGGDTISGLVAQQSSTTYKLYLTNASTMTCKGDIIIDGTVFLNNLSLDTGDAGCRLYVTGSVFIQGPINYVNGGNSNLQISSARAVVMGMRSLGARLTQNATPVAVSGIRRGWTDDQELNFNVAIINDRDNIDGLVNDAGPYEIMTDLGGTVLAILDDYDAPQWVAAPGRTTYPDPSTCSQVSTPPGNQPCAIKWADTYNRKTVNYSHVLLNAPKIYSRYYGKFQGVVIGEDVLFAIDNFTFESDPVMLQTTLLPLVQNRIFNMSSD